MSHRRPKFLLAGVSLLIVGTVAVIDFGRRSPGPLASVHAAESELGGLGSCANCHGGWFGTMTESCVECHEDIERHIATGDGLHGKLGRTRANQCATCHSEHHGEHFDLVNRKSFLKAGVETPEKFDHEFVGFTMNGKHRALQCAECHKQAEARPLPKGAKRFIGLEKNCASCHEDAHDGRMRIACAECHGQTGWDQFEAVHHEKVLPLTGGHAKVACAACHKEDTGHSLHAIGEGREVAARSCLDCHKSPHRREFLGEDACGSCHKADHTTWNDEKMALSAEQHARSGYALVVPHDKVECQACHTAGTDDFLARYPGRTQDDCAACHEDVHDGQFGKGPFAERGCLGCHDRKHFDPHTFTEASHRRTALPLTGRHKEADCNACHKVSERTGVRVFAGTPTECAECHEDTHRGFFDAHKEELQRAQGGACASCHTTRRFSELPAEGFDHGKFTEFTLRGAHAQERCEICHVRSKKPDETGRTFGRSADRFGHVTGCDTCHLDPHEGDFDRTGLPKQVKGKRNCERCHVETSFRTFPTPFDHGQWTGFRLDGKHREASCNACHTPLRRPGKNGRTWSRARGHLCADCHEDPHAAQFQRHGVTRCERCHQRATSFSKLMFSHDVHSRFRLGKAHANVACDACHKPVRIGKQTLVRYRPLDRRCSNCHEGVIDPLRKKGRK